MVIGHANHITCDRVGNAQSTGCWCGQLLQIKISADGRFKRFVGSTGQYQNMLDATLRRRLPSEPGVGAAHISQ